VPDLMPPAVPAGSLRSLPQPTLRVDELTLRPWHGTDVDAVVDAYRDPDIQRWHVRSMSYDEARAWIASWPSSVGLHRIELNHSTLNTASCRIAAKAGFGYEGTTREQGLHGDGWHDMHLHARLASDADDVTARAR
jgi:ribosomal-protein-alanine N-acetyltransferase